MEQAKRLELIPLETLLLVIDIQRDFLEMQEGFVFFDQSKKSENIQPMQNMVKTYLEPFIRYSLMSMTHVAYVQAEYPIGKFSKPFDKLCYCSPGKDFYLIDKIQNDGIRFFKKNEHDSFTNPELSDYILNNNIRNVIVTGITVTSCINATVTSTLMPAGLQIIVPKNCVSYRKDQEERASQYLMELANPKNKVILLNSSAQIDYKRL